MSDESVGFIERSGALPRRQRGLSLVGLIFLGLIAIVLLTIGFKLVPSLIEYLAVDRAVQKIKNEGSTVRDLRNAFDKYATIDDIKSITGKDLDITKDADGVVISYAYSYSVPLTDNVRLVIDYSGSTRDRHGKAP
jgi:Zn-dependent membrane protease YugP